MRNSVLIALILLFLAPQLKAEDCVILLHGLARSDLSMSKMATALSETYQVVNHEYPTLRNRIQELAAVEVPEALEQCTPEVAEIHFVTHSLGGILLRQYLQNNSIEKLGRAVMLGPPNHGSEVVDRLDSFIGFQLLGPAVSQLGTDEESVPDSLGPVNFELGIIAGDHSMNPLFSWMVPNRDDGAVSVASTRLEGMADHIVLPVTHPFMTRNDEVIRQTLHFLEFGEFDHESAE